MNLEAKQTEKLKTAAQYDIERFFHVLDIHRVQTNQANSAKVRLNTEFFGSTSMLAKTLTNTVTEAQKGQLLRNLHELRIQ